MAQRARKRAWAGLGLTPLGISVLYALAGMLWILFSDRLLAVLVPGGATASWLQTGKGSLFVLVTASLLYVLIRRGMDTVRRTEADLARSQTTLATLMQTLPGMVYRCRLDRKWTMEFVSNGCEDLTGYRPHALMQNSEVAFGDIIHPEDRDMVWNRVNQAVYEDRSFELVYRIIHADGDVRWVRERGRGVHSAAGPLSHLEGFISDITDHRQLEAQLLQSQKMESIGRMAGEVAHDFNNLLTAISGHSQLMLAEFEPDDPRRSDLEEIRRVVEQATALTRQLLSFSRSGGFHPEQVDLNRTITRLDRMLRRLVGEEIELVMELDPELAPIWADPSRLEQVIVNLVVNARDAIVPDSGTVTISTTNANLERDNASSAKVRPGQYVLLEVTDDGTGIDAETMDRIFEPFFTTKPEGEGTGLGLSTVFGIVKQSGGEILVESGPGAGACFRIFLPCISKASAA